MFTTVLDKRVSGKQTNFSILNNFPICLSISWILWFTQLINIYCVYGKHLHILCFCQFPKCLLKLNMRHSRSIWEILLFDPFRSNVFEAFEFLTRLLPICVVPNHGSVIWKLLYIKWKCWSLSCVQPFAIPGTVAHQAPLFMEFSKQEYWSRLPFPSSEDLPNPNRGSNPGIRNHRQNHTDWDNREAGTQIFFEWKKKQ